MESEHLDPMQLERHVDGELRGDEATRAASHVEACQRCQREVEDRRRLHAMLAEAFAAEVEQANLRGVWPNVRRSIASRRPAVEWSLGDVLRALVRPRFATAAAAALVVAALIVAGLLVWMPERPMLAQVEEVIAPEDLRVTIAVERLAASGTTVVWINGLSVIEDNGG